MPNNNPGIFERIRFYITEEVHFTRILYLLISINLIISMFYLKTDIAIPGTDAEIKALYIVIIVSAISYFIVAQTGRMIDEYVESEMERARQKKIIMEKETKETPEEEFTVLNEMQDFMEEKGRQ